MFTFRTRPMLSLMFTIIRSTVKVYHSQSTKTITEQYELLFILWEQCLWSVIIVITHRTVACHTVACPNTNNNWQRRWGDGNPPWRPRHGPSAGPRYCRLYTLNTDTVHLGAWPPPTRNPARKPRVRLDANCDFCEPSSHWLKLSV